jgi:hypothetical protein
MQINIIKKQWLVSNVNLADKFRHQIRMNKLDRLAQNGQVLETVHGSASGKELRDELAEGPRIRDAVNGLSSGGVIYEGRMAKAPKEHGRG